MVKGINKKTNKNTDKKLSKKSRQALGFLNEITRTEDKNVQAVETLKSDNDKSFDDIINEILSEVNDDENTKSSEDEFEEMMQEVESFTPLFFAKSSVEEVDNTLTYRFGEDTHLRLFEGYDLDKGLIGEEYREEIHLQTSNLLSIEGTFNTSKIRIEKYPDTTKIGKVFFNHEEKQKADNLIIENVGVVGSFDVPIVSIHDTSYVDIDLDISDKTKCTYLLIDTRFDRVRGKINLSYSFYNQLNNQNKLFLILVNSQNNNHTKNGKAGIQILVEGRPICEEFENTKVPENAEQEYSYLKTILQSVDMDD